MLVKEITLKGVLKTACRFALYCLLIHMLIVLFLLSHYPQLEDQSEREIPPYCQTVEQKMPVK